MYSWDLTPEMMREESRVLIRSLKSRIANVEGLGASAPQHAVNLFRELEKTIPKRLTSLSDKELRTLYRDLKYINALKSSTVQGAKRAQKTFEPIRTTLESLSKPTQDKFWSVYGRMFERLGGIFEDYKYEIMNADIDYILQGQDVDKTTADLIKTFDKTLMELGSSATDEKVRVLFAKKIKELQRQSE